MNDSRSTDITRRYKKMSKTRVTRCAAVCSLLLGVACGQGSGAGAGTGAGSGGDVGSGGSTAPGSGGGAVKGATGGAIAPVDAGAPTGSGGRQPPTGTGGATGSGARGGTGTGGALVASSGGSSGAAGASAGARSVSTEPNLKIAFAADTDVGATWTQVGALIKAEGAAAVVVAGDMAYDNSQPAAWWAATDAALGSAFPIFLAKGNHDDDTKWPGFASVSNQRLATWGAVRTPSTLNDATYTTTFKGLEMLAISDSGIADGPRYATYIQSQLANDNHIWRICQWHKNQQAMQAGGKPDEVGWEPYEACRAAGAIIQTGHEHSYARTKTLTGFMSRTVDPTCATGDALCVGPGRTFAQTVGTGGRDSPLRIQTQCLPIWMSPLVNSGTCPYWAVIYTASQNGVAGAQFITFNVGGNPKKATGYFKTITGQVVDTFTITAD